LSDKIVPLHPKPRDGDAVVKPYAARGPHCGQMEMSPVEIRQSARSGFEAELRGDAPLSGEHGYWVSVVGWGPTEAQALAIKPQLIKCESAHGP
jgi:hypothetical protein